MLPVSLAFASAHPAPQTQPQSLSPKPVNESTTNLNQKLSPKFGCHSISPMAEDDWCAQGCSNIPQNCPPDLCECPDESTAGLSVAGNPDLKAPDPRIIGGWTNCPELAPNGELRNEDTDYLINYSHQLCLQDEETDEQPGMPAATSEWGPSYKSDWGANAILPGKFGQNEVAPVDGGKYKYRWVTVGGQGTDSSDWQETAEQDILDQGAGGCAFDEEGGVSAKDAAPWIQEMRKKHKDWTFIYVPECGAEVMQYDPDSGGCDYIAPMMYNGNHDSYPRMDLSIKPESPFIAECLTHVHEAGWPAARTILTYQSFDAYRTRKESKLMNLLGKMLGKHTVTLPSGETLSGPYAGVLGWPAQCGQGDARCWPEADRLNLKEILKGQKETSS
jgi:hypothetical protein